MHVMSEKKNGGDLEGCNSKYITGGTLNFVPLDSRSECPGRSHRFHTSEITFLRSFGAAFHGSGFDGIV